MSSIDSKKRESNFELLRIVSMLMIVTLHYIQNSSISDGGQNMKIFSSFLGAICSVGVNCFVLISGYFLINSKFKIQKIINLWGLVLFYSYGIFIVHAIFNHNVLSKMNLLDIIYVFTPVLNVHYWFIVPYIALYFVFPFLNKGLKSLRPKEFKTLLIIFFFLLCAINNITPFTRNFEAVGGHSILWFMFVYSVGAYIRLYYSSKGLTEKYEKYKYLLLFFSIVLLGFIVKNLFGIVSNINLLTEYFYYRSMAYNSIFVFIASVLLFMFFKNINISSNYLNIAINAISKNVFAVYLIHEHQLNRKVIWNSFLNVNSSGMNNYFIIHYILSVLLIFVVCVLIEQIRKTIFALVLKLPFFSSLKDKLQKLYDKINKKFAE